MDESSVSVGLVVRRTENKVNKREKISNNQHGLKPILAKLFQLCLGGSGFIFLMR